MNDEFSMFRTKFDEICSIVTDVFWSTETTLCPIFTESVARRWKWFEPCLIKGPWVTLTHRMLVKKGIGKGYQVLYLARNWLKSWELDLSMKSWDINEIFFISSFLKITLDLKSRLVRTENMVQSWIRLAVQMFSPWNIRSYK